MFESSFYRNVPQCLTPPVDIYDSDDAVFVSAEMPGVPKERMEVEIEGRELTIRGYLRHDIEGQRLVREFPRCDYYRAFRLSDAIDTDKIEASMAQGVLTLKLSKRESAEPYEVPISTE